MQEIHRCDFACDHEEFGLGNWVWNSCNKSETVSHGDQKASVEASFAKLLETGDVVFIPLYC